MAQKPSDAYSVLRAETIRNIAFTRKRKLKSSFLNQLYEMRAHTRPDFPDLTFENGDGPDIIQTFQDLHENYHRFARALLDVGLEKY